MSSVIEWRKKSKARCSWSDTWSLECMCLERWESKIYKWVNFIFCLVKVGGKGVGWLFSAVQKLDNYAWQRPHWPHAASAERHGVQSGRIGVGGYRSSQNRRLSLEKKVRPGWRDELPKGIVKAKCRDWFVKVSLNFQGGVTFNVLI